MPDVGDARAELLGQLALFADELDAQRAVLDLIPDSLATARLPNGEPTLLELYGVLVARGERVYPELCVLWSPGPAAPDTLSIEGFGDRIPDEDALVRIESWNEQTIPDLASRAQASRTTLVEALHSLPVEAWSASRTIAGVSVTLVETAFQITQEDTDVLRRIAVRLFEGRSGMGSGAAGRNPRD